MRVAVTKRAAHHSFIFVLPFLTLACAQPLVRFQVDAGLPEACAAGLLRCGPACVDTRLDDAHCGGCGMACSPLQSCAAGGCYPDDCPPADCASNQVCVNGACSERTCVGVLCGAGFTCLTLQATNEACDLLRTRAGSNASKQ